MMATDKPATEGVYFTDVQVGDILTLATSEKSGDHTWYERHTARVVKVTAKTVVAHDLHEVSLDWRKPQGTPRAYRLTRDTWGDRRVERVVSTEKPADPDDGLSIERAEINGRTTFHVTENGRRLPDQPGKPRTKKAAEQRIAAIRGVRELFAQSEADKQRHLDSIGAPIAAADMQPGQTVWLARDVREPRRGGRTYTVDHTEVLPNGVVMLHWRGQTTDIGPLIITPNMHIRLVTEEF